MSNESITDDLELAKEISDALQEKDARIKYLLTVAEQLQRSVEWNVYEGDLLRRINLYLKESATERTGHEHEISLSDINQERVDLQQLQDYVATLDRELSRIRTYIGVLDTILQNRQKPQRDIRVLKKILRDIAAETSTYEHKHQEIDSFLRHIEHGILLSGQRS